jgi:hypothetical protein
MRIKKTKKGRKLAPHLFIKAPPLLVVPMGFFFNIIYVIIGKKEQDKIRKSSLHV